MVPLQQRGEGRGGGLRGGNTDDRQQPRGSALGHAPVLVASARPPSSFQMNSAEAPLAGPQNFQKAISGARVAGQIHTNKSLNPTARRRVPVPRQSCRPQTMAWFTWKDPLPSRRTGCIWYIPEPIFPTQGPHFPMPMTQLPPCFWNGCRLLWAAMCLASPLVSAVDDYDALVDPNTGLPLTSRFNAHLPFPSALWRGGIVSPRHPGSCRAALHHIASCRPSLFCCGLS